MGFAIAPVFAAQCERTLEEKELIDRLRQENYDVYIVENADMCGMGELFLNIKKNLNLKLSQFDTACMCFTNRTTE